MTISNSSPVLLSLRRRLLYVHPSVERFAVYALITSPLFSPRRVGRGVLHDIAELRRAHVVSAVSCKIEGREQPRERYVHKRACAHYQHTLPRFLVRKRAARVEARLLRLRIVVRRPRLRASRSRLSEKRGTNTGFRPSYGATVPAPCRRKTRARARRGSAPREMPSFVRDDADAYHYQKDIKLINYICLR